MIKHYQKIKLLSEICNYYNYTLTLEGDEKIITDGFMQDFYFEFKSLDDALLYWVETLIDTDDMLLSYGDPTQWREEIHFIYKNCK